MLPKCESIVFDLAQLTCRVCPQALSPLNMQKRFSVLLWLEELHARRELKEFSISGALLKKGARYLDLDVPGMTEGRPHISSGESMTVANVCLEAVVFCFSQTLSWQVCCPGDKVLLKKPQRNGMVVEYISYVTEVCLPWHLQNQMLNEFRFPLCFILFWFRSTMKRSVWELTRTFSTATLESHLMLSSLTTGWTKSFSLFKEMHRDYAFI